MPSTQVMVTITLSEAKTSTAIGPGVSLDRFFSIVLNDAGQVVFSATLAGAGVDTTNSIGIFSGSGDTLGVVVRQGDTVPGTNLNFGGLSLPILNDAGQIVFRARLNGPDVTTRNDFGIVSDANGVVGLVAREGDSAPVARTGVRFDSFVNEAIVMNNAGNTAFATTLTGTGVTTLNDVGIYSASGDMRNLVARKDIFAPVGEPDVAFRFSFSKPVLNGSGQLAFSAILKGTGVDLANDTGLFSYSGDTLSLVVREGAPIANAGPGVNLGHIGDPTLNDAGETAFWATVAGVGVDSTSNTGIFSVSANTLNLVAREGDAAPGAGAGVKLSEFDSPVLSDTGRVAFFADLAGTGLNGRNDSGLLTESNGELSLLAREGAQTPGTQQGVNFRGFGPPTLNGADQVAFGAVLTGAGVNSTNDMAIFATDQTDILRLVVREGDLFDVDPAPLATDFRTINSVGFIPGSGDSDGRSRSFNDAGQLAFKLGFTDGTEGVFVATIGVPEPTSMMLLVLQRLDAIVWPLQIRLTHA
jgi:hypothetical protein